MICREPGSGLHQTPAWACADAYLFDIDGTLLHVRDATHYFAFHHAVKRVFGVSSHIDGVPIHGNTDVGILRAVLRREGLDDAVVEPRLAEVLSHMCDEVESKATEVRCELCPSARQLLELLKSHGKTLGVVSGNLQRIGRIKLERAGVGNYFAFGCFADTAEVRHRIFSNGIAETRRLLGESAAVCFIGDTPEDVKAARSLQAPVIAVATGTYTVEDLEVFEPDVCFSSFTELLASLCRWLAAD